MAKNAYFIRKGVVLDASLRKLNSSDLIPMKNIVIDPATDENLDEIIVPSLGRTIQVINSLKDATADVKYYAIVIDQLTLPTASEIQMLYTSIADGEALLVQDTSDNAWKALSAFDKTVEILNNDGSTTTLQTIRAELNDGILYLVEQTGVYETAIFTAKGWQLDQTKNVVPAKLEDLYAKTELNANAIAVLEAWKTATDLRLGDNGEFLNKSNNKDITSKGTIAFNGTPLEGGKIATRQDVGSGFATIKQTADSLAQTVTANKTAQDAIKTTADSAKTQSDTNKANIEHNRTDIDAHKAILDTAVTKNTEQDSKITALETAKTLNDAKNIEQDNRLTATEVKANTAYTQAQDWAETKAQVALIADLNSPIENTTNIGITANGNNAEIILTAPAIAGLKEGKNVVLHFLRDNVTPKRANSLLAKYNDASETLGESLVIEGVVVPVTTSISNNKVVITGLNTTQLNTFITNYRLVLVEQASGATGVSMDATARAKADSADAKAVQAQTDATYAKNKIDALDLTPLQTATATAQAKADQADGKADTNKTAIDLLNTWKTSHTSAFNTLVATVGDSTTGIVKDIADLKAKNTAQDGIINGKQESSDQSLTTNDKTIVGAIKEINQAYKDADTSLHTTITTEQSSKIKYYTGQIAIFNTEKVAPSKFADTTLFTPNPIKENGNKGQQNIIFNATTASISSIDTNIDYDKYELLDGSITIDTYGYTMVPLGSMHQNSNTYAMFIDQRVNPATAQGTSKVNKQIKLENNNGKIRIVITDDGTNSKADIGLRFVFSLKYVETTRYEYIAKKDITFAEMGE